LALLKIPADDFDLPDFLPAFFLVVALGFFELEPFLEVPVAVDFFFVVFLVAIVFLCSFGVYLSNSGAVAYLVPSQHL
jgi:hypothetical protein